jgi:hypothetical protein
MKKMKATKKKKKKKSNQYPMAKKRRSRRKRWSSWKTRGKLYKRKVEEKDDENGIMKIKKKDKQILHKEVRESRMKEDHAPESRAT